MDTKTCNCAEGLHFSAFISFISDATPSTYTLYLRFSWKIAISSYKHSHNIHHFRLAFFKKVLSLYRHGSSTEKGDLRWFRQLNWSTRNCITYCMACDCSSQQFASFGRRSEIVYRITLGTGVVPVNFLIWHFYSKTSSIVKCIHVICNFRQCYDQVTK